jgi:hypothetical protein
MQRGLRITLAVAATAGALALGAGTAFADDNSTHDYGPISFTGPGFQPGHNSFTPKYSQGDASSHNGHDEDGDSGNPLSGMMP